MKFHSQTLQSSFDEAKPILERLSSNDAAIAADILLLETYLKSVNFKESITYKIKSKDTLAHQEELLVWDHYQQKIFYIKNAFKALFVTTDKGYARKINYHDKETLVTEALTEASTALKKALWTNGVLASFLSFLTLKARAKIPEEIA